MLGRLALLFILVPLAELALLVRLGQWVGLWPTIGLVAVTGVLGASLARAEGLRTLGRFRSEVAAGKVPGGALMDGIAVLVGGAFLLTPGLLTDVAGFLLLLPPTRRWIRKRVRRWIEDGIASGRIQVVSLGTGPLGGGPFGPFGGHGSAGPSDRDPELDPRNEIRAGPGAGDRDP